MEQNRTIASNTIGNDNYIIQGDVNYNHYAGNNAETPPGQVDNVLQCLYKSPYKDRKNRNPERVQGTCDWFVSHEHFRTWNESSSSSLLWVSADPGCGKSVLVRHLVDSVVQTTASRTVCYFFFKDDFPDQKNVVIALCCILRQIFEQKPSLLSEAILKRFNTGGETFNASFSELWQTLLQVVDDKNAGEIVCLLDAIDECEDQSDQGRSQLLKALCTLYGTAGSFNVKFLITSRPYVEIHRGLQPLDIPGLPVIHLSGESEDEMEKISQEINVYISARVQDVGQRLQLTQRERGLLLQRLMEVPNRTYLWVYLTLDLVESSIHVTEKMILEATSNIPITIDQAYERILSRSSNTRQARIIFHIIVAAARPLTLTEMNFALASSESRQPHPDMELVPDDRFRENLRNICGLCVMIVDSKIYLLHQTVKEFLVKRNITETFHSDSGDYEWKYSIQPKESHIVLAKICIWHLLAGSKLEHKSGSWHAWKDTFLDYSAKYWVSHFREMDSEAQSMLTESILTICDVNSLCCKTWFATHWSTMQTDYPQGFTTLIMTSYFGLNFAVHSLLDMDLDLNVQDETYQRSALCWAVRNGFRMVAELLIGGSRIKLGNFKLPLRKRAKIDLQDKYGRIPLTYAIWNGDAALVKLLMKAGANVHLEDNLGQTPLFYAFCNSDHGIIDIFVKKKKTVDVENGINQLLFTAIQYGHEEVVMQLLKTGRANTEAKVNGGETVLIFAIRAFNKAIVKMLLEAGANPDVRDRFGNPVLIVAIPRQEAVVKMLLEAGADANAEDHYSGPALIVAINRQEAAVKMLLEAGANPNAKDSGGNPALIVAIYRQEATVKLLLEAGADANALEGGEENRTALMCASERGVQTVVESLLGAGADPNARSNSGFSALMYASIGGHEAILKLLLDARADVNAQRNAGGTALSYASFNGYSKIVKLLLEAGARKESGRR